MNQVIKTIMERRSIRSFKKEQISSEALAEILDAAIYSPTARGTQKWHFSVLQNSDVIRQLSDGTKKAVIDANLDFIVERAKDPAFSFCFNAPTAIVISMEKGWNYFQADSAIAAQTICIAAKSLGLGSVITAFNGPFFATKAGQDFAKTIGVPDTHAVSLIVYLGYADGNEPQPAPRKENLINFVK